MEERMKAIRDEERARNADDGYVEPRARARGRRDDDDYDYEPRARARGRRDDDECEDCECSISDQIDDFVGCTGDGEDADDWIDRMLDL